MTTNQNGISQLDVYIGARALDDQIEMIMPTFDLLKEQIEQIRSAKKGDSNGKREYNNTIGIFGERGTGKTSAIFTLQKYLNDEGNKYKNILLPIIEPDLFGDNTKIMGSIVGLLKDAVKKLLEQFPKENAVDNEALREYYNNGILKKQNPLWQKTDQLIEYHLYTESQYRTLLTQHYDDLATHINKSSRLLIPDIKFKEKLTNLINELINVKQKLHKITDDVLLFIFIDDIDLKTNKTRELVDSILQYADHPRVVTVLSGDYKQLSESLTVALIRDEQLRSCSLTPQTIISTSLSEKEKRTILNRKQELSHEYLKKIIPPARRHQLVTWNLETIPRFAFDKVNLLDQLQTLTEKNHIFGYRTPDSNEWVPIKNSFVIFDTKPRGLVNVYYHLYQTNQIFGRMSEKNEKQQAHLFIHIKGLIDIIISSSKSLADQALILGKFLNWGNNAESSILNYEITEETDKDSTPDYRLVMLILGEIVKILLPKVRVDEEGLLKLKRDLFFDLANITKKPIDLKQNDYYRKWNYPLFHVVYGIMVNLDTRTALLLLELLSGSNHDSYFYEFPYSADRYEKDRFVFECLYQLSLVESNFFTELYVQSHRMKKDEVNDSINFLSEFCALPVEFSITEKTFNVILGGLYKVITKPHMQRTIRFILINTLTEIRKRIDRTETHENYDLSGTITVVANNNLNKEYRTLNKINENIKNKGIIPIEITRTPDRVSEMLSIQIQEKLKEINVYTIYLSGELVTAIKDFLKYSKGSESTKIKTVQRSVENTFHPNLNNLNEKKISVQSYIEVYKEVERLAQNNRVWFGQYQASQLLFVMNKEARFDETFFSGYEEPLIEELATYYSATNPTIKEDIELEKKKEEMRKNLKTAYDEVRQVTKNSLGQFGLTLEDDEFDADDK